MTVENVAGLAPELKGAKKGQGSKPLASASERFTSYDVEAFEVPGGREENWRFTPLRRLRGLHDGSAPFDGTAVVEVTGAGEGVTVERVSRDDPRLGEGGVPADRVAAQAWSAAPDATVVTLDGSPAPLDVTVTGPGAGVTAAAHLQLRTTPARRGDRGARRSVGSGALADNLEVVLADGSRLTPGGHRRVGRRRRARRRRSTCALGRDATLRGDLGGAGRRPRPDQPHGRATAAPAATSSSPGSATPTPASTSSSGCWSTTRCRTAGRTCSTRTRCRAQGADAHTVWIGDVLIRAAAENTETFELNRNLVLTERARADSVPNLEIETGEIAGAGHASATGRFDDEQLFYLQSRGIPEDVARRLVVRGFFGEILARLPLPELRERLEAAIEAELAVTGV